MPNILSQGLVLCICILCNSLVLSKNSFLLTSNHTNCIPAWIDRFCVQKKFRKELDDLLVRKDPHLINKVLEEFPIDPESLKKPSFKKPKQQKSLVARVVETEKESELSDVEDEEKLTTADFEYVNPTTVNHVKLGCHVHYKNEIFLVTHAQHISQARGKSHYKFRLKDLGSEKESSYSFSDTSRLDVIVPSKLTCKFVSIDPTAGTYHFIRTDNGKEVVLPKNHHNPYLKFLRRDLLCTLHRFKDIVISLIVPFNIDYKVINLDTYNFAATLENNLVVTVPSYVKIGDVVQVSTIKCEFMRRILMK